MHRLANHQRPRWPKGYPWYMRRMSPVACITAVMCGWRAHIRQSASACQARVRCVLRGRFRSRMDVCAPVVQNTGSGVIDIGFARNRTPRFSIVKREAGSVGYIKTMEVSLNERRRGYAPSSSTLLALKTRRVTSLCAFKRGSSVVFRFLIRLSPESTTRCAGRTRGPLNIMAIACY